MNTYEITIPERHWGRELIRFIQAETAGAAKYNYWLKFQDCYTDMEFGDFVKAIKCRKVKDITLLGEKGEGQG